jgi:hypothetical protein
MKRQCLFGFRGALKALTAIVRRSYESVTPGREKHFRNTLRAVSTFEFVPAERHFHRWATIEGPHECRATSPMTALTENHRSTGNSGGQFCAKDTLHFSAWIDAGVIDVKVEHW